MNVELQVNEGRTVAWADVLVIPIVAQDLSGTRLGRGEVVDRAPDMAVAHQEMRAEVRQADRDSVQDDITRYVEETGL